MQVGQRPTSVGKRSTWPGAGRPRRGRPARFLFWRTAERTGGPVRASPYVTHMNRPSPVIAACRAAPARDQTEQTATNVGVAAGRLCRVIAGLLWWKLRGGIDQATSDARRAAMARSLGSGAGSSRSMVVMSCGVSSTSGMSRARGSASSQRKGSIPMRPAPSRACRSRFDPRAPSLSLRWKNDGGYPAAFSNSSRIPRMRSGDSLMSYPEA